MNAGTNIMPSNPRLLLESPKKLRGENSPVKRLRDQALAMKSPLKELDSNAMKLSPVKFNSHAPPSPSPTRPQNIRLSPFRLEKEGIGMEIEKLPAKRLFLQDPVPSLSNIDHLEEHGSRPPKSSEQEHKKSQTPTEVEPKLTVISLPVRIPGANIVKSGDVSQGLEDYDASVEEDNSFQAIRTAIRKSIVQKSLPKADSNGTPESSFKSADEGPQPSSMVVHPTSSRQEPNDISVNLSVETTKVPLKDEGSNRKKSIVSNTPPPAKRESQGFALLPHREPLALKSAKKKEQSKARLSLFNDEISKEHRETLAKALLYPTLSLEPTNPFSATPTVSTLDNATTDDTKVLSNQIKATEVLSLTLEASTIPKLSPVEFSEPSALKSPNPSPHKAQRSPLSNLFASVNSTLQKARNKFIKETQHVVEDTDKVHKPKRSSPARVEKYQVNQSPKKWNVTNKDVELLNRLAVPTDASQAKTLAKNYLEKSPQKPNLRKTSPQKAGSNENQKSARMVISKSPQKIDAARGNPEKDTSACGTKDDDDDIDLKRSSFKFSPVKSIYASLRHDMNQTTQVSPVQVEKKAAPRNLARVSLAKPDDKALPPRKSISRSGLTAMSLEPKSRPRQKSLVSDQPNQSVKRKPQAEDDNRPAAMSQAYRKIGTKIIAPSASQTKAQQDAKRRRTAEQLQSVLQKRAARVSQVSHQPHSTTSEEDPAKMGKPPSKYTMLNNQTLMKTAVLQNARLNNDGKCANPFQSSGSNFASSKSNAPVTPKAPTVLPEIFSESDDDEEGSVLKDWANSPELRHILINQQHLDPDKVFGPVAPLQMEEIFHGSRAVSKFKHRGSSAQWTRDGLTTQEVENYKTRMVKR
jgi:hypothetical protein